eukprot:jgi/Ulvmu1/4067/UM019_0045.1
MTAVYPTMPALERHLEAAQYDNSADQPPATLNATQVKLGAGVSKWSFLARMFPCVPSIVVPDLYTVAERQADQVDECIARIPLVDNDAEPDEGAITLQEKTWLLSRYRTIGLIKVLCGVLVPAIVSSLSTFEPGSSQRTSLMQTSIMLSVLGTLSVALEDFFQFGARATAMKTCVMIIDKEFWEWYSCSGMYSRIDGVPNYFRTHQAFQNLAKQIEETIFAAQEGYLNTIMAGSSKKDD